MAKKQENVPRYGTAMRRGIQYYRTRITDADGKRVDLYAETCEELQLKEMEARRQVEEAVFRRKHPTVAEYCEKWLLMQSAKVSSGTLRGYTQTMNNYIVKPLGDMYLEDVTADDIRLAMIPLASKSAGLYSKVNMLLKCVFYSAERSQLLEYNPCEGLSAKGGKPGKKINALTDEQVKLLLDTVRGLPPYTFIMIALYSGLRREEILGLQWDCVFLDVPTPYISVRRAWRSEHNRPVISTTLKTKAARRDIPIPKCLTDCLREVKEKTESEYVVADRNGNPLSSSQFQRVWKYVTVRSTKPHNYYKYVNGQCVKCTVTPTPGSHQKNNPKLVYAIDFDVTPHQLRHTYITNLLYAGIDPKTVQYLAGHENSKTTMDIYAQVKYNKPEELLSVVNQDTRPFAIYSDDTIVGFVSMYVGEDNYQIINFLIDDAFQRKGYGSKAVKLCIEYLQREFSACRISAPVKMEHIAAQEFWIKQGFCLSDTIEDGYVFMRLFLT